MTPVNPGSLHMEEHHALKIRYFTLHRSRGSLIFLREPFYSKTVYQAVTDYLAVAC